MNILKLRNLVCLLFLLNGVLLAETDTFVCNYPKFSDAEGKHQSKSEFRLTFLIDRGTGKAYMVGNNGSNEMVLIEKGDQISFLEITDTGNVMTTTITSKMQSVHSRNSVMFGDLIPSQYYGVCKRQ